MNVLGFGLIAGGMALLFSGLIFLWPLEREASSSEETFEHSRERMERYLAQMRKEGR
jgi:hypothetical protein